VTGVLGREFSIQGGRNGLAKAIGTHGQLIRTVLSGTGLIATPWHPA
jgi:hypothetical protein